ncbi:hypothetical protein VNO78_22476 [Psophocarpus tetragonolobus]|uniref:Uncharacterized protein n=1 Tax=Psophocarpus tetragonolobus TaxID=3891 RepID=A0AAN9S2Z0_PSOTE
MRRKIHDPIGVRSSIVLLQERFRQLQRVKEMRKKRELLKMLATDPKHFNSNSTTRQFLDPELMIPSRLHPHVSLSLWPASQCMQEYNISTIETPGSKNIRFIDCTHRHSLQASWKNAYDWNSGSESDSGVDTSLHLSSRFLIAKENEVGMDLRIELFLLDILNGSRTIAWCLAFEERESLYSGLSFFFRMKLTK